MAPSESQIDRARTYLAELEGIHETGGLKLNVSIQENTGCFWRLEFTSTQQKHVVAYLSPDRSYVVREVYDLNVNPEDARTQQLKRTMEQVSSDNPPERGPDTAKIKVVEFGDFQCPACRRLYEALQGQQTSNSPVQIRLIFRNYPLEMHPWAESSAEMAACARIQDQNLFWKLYDYFFTHQESISSENLHDKVVEVLKDEAHYDPAQFARCVDTHLTKSIVEADLDLGHRYGVNGTPTLFIDGIRYDGVPNIARLREILTAAEGEQVKSGAAPEAAVSATTVSSSAVRSTEAH
jgi:protein-disulfide isomerase